MTSLKSSKDNMSSSTSIDYIVPELKRITPKDIENEFIDILQVHKTSIDEININHDTSSVPSSNVLSHRTHFNGTFKDTVVFRENDDTFITFPHTLELISPVNLSQFWSAYEKYKHTHNIVIDSRMQLLIMYSALAYADELIVYNPYTTKIVNLYDFCSDLFKISAAELNIRQIQELFIMKMVISYFLYDNGISWQVNQIISNLKELHKYTAVGTSKKTIIDILMNYLRCRCIETYDRKRVIELYQQFHKYFGRDAFNVGTPMNNTKRGQRKNSDIIICKWKIPGLTIEEIYITFMLLKQSNFTFVKNDDM